MGLMATVARSGDADAGAIILKINHFRDGCEVYTPVTAPDGSPAWMRALPDGASSEADADRYISRQIQYDSDIWVVEVEDPKGQFTLDERVIDA